MTDSKEVYSFTAFNDDYAFSDDGYFTYSSTEQKRVEDSVSERYKEFLGECMEDIEETKHFTPVLHRSVHIHYICRTLVELGRSFQVSGVFPMSHLHFQLMKILYLIIAQFISG
ncbi:unnamed protein product [Anisakis simplex]|uniref:Protein-tyrosine-phosphatase n=1 Tax=Anisakis simplex TaxID=6269 RepID=A0A0M3JEF0_ANISI|nr:unnamed protein product [Anisakis simplex]